MKRSIGYILMIAGIALAIWGITMLGDSEASIAIGDFAIEAENESQQTQAYLLIGLGVIGFIGGLFAILQRRGS